MHPTEEEWIAEIETRLFGSPVSQLEARIRRTPVLGRVWTLISTNYADGSLSLPRVARIAGANKDHLNRLLVRASGLTFKQLLIRVRLLNATEILRAEPDVHVDEIAFRVGLSPSSLTRQFKAKTGVYPSAWRKGLLKPK